MLRPLQSRFFFSFKCFCGFCRLFDWWFVFYIKLSESYGEEHNNDETQRNTNRSLFHHIHLPAKENHLKNWHLVPSICPLTSFFLYLSFTHKHTQRKCGRVLDACSVWQLTKCHMDVTGFYNLDTREHNLHSNYERRKRRRSRAGRHLDRLEGDGRSTMWAAVGGEFRGGTALLCHTFFRVLKGVGLLTMT